MSTNQSLLKKADMAVADLSANGGLLNPEQSSTFIRKLLAQPTLLRQARRVVMRSPQMKIPKIHFAKRILRAGGQGVTLDTAAIAGAFDPLAEAAARAKALTEQIELTSKGIVAEIRLPYDVIEDNIERGNLGSQNDQTGSNASGGIKDTIMTLIAERAALDLEELSILGDTSLSGSDPYLALLDGFLKRITSNVVDASNAPISRTVFKNGMKTLPSQYRRNRNAMRHFVSTEQEIEYRDTLASRETAVGDSMLVNGVAPVFGSGSPVEGIALMPGAKGMLVNPMNLIFGIQRDIRVETDRDIREQEFIIVLSARVDVQVEEEEAAVKYSNIAV